MKLKLDAEGHVVVDDGKPVYTDDAGADIAFDVVGTKATIARLNGEAKGHREAKEAAVDALKAFDGISDPAKAREAIDMLSKIDAKKLVESGDMDAAIKAALAPVQNELAAEKTKNTDLSGSLSREVIGNRLGASKFATEKLTPAGIDLIRTMFADRMTVENGKLVGLDVNGGKIYSQSSPGEMASTDEILESFVSLYPHKDHIMRGNEAQGSGAQNNGGSGGAKTMSNAEFNQLQPKDRASKMAGGLTLTE